MRLRGVLGDVDRGEKLFAVAHGDAVFVFGVMRLDVVFLGSVLGARGVGSGERGEREQQAHPSAGYDSRHAKSPFPAIVEGKFRAPIPGLKRRSVRSVRVYSKTASASQAEKVGAEIEGTLCSIRAPGPGPRPLPFFCKYVIRRDFKSFVSEVCVPKGFTGAFLRISVIPKRLGQKVTRDRGLVTRERGEERSAHPRQTAFLRKAPFVSQFVS